MSTKAVVLYVCKCGRKSLEKFGTHMRANKTKCPALPVGLTMHTADEMAAARAANDVTAQRNAELVSKNDALNDRVDELQEELRQIKSTSRVHETASA